MILEYLDLADSDFTLFLTLAAATIFSLLVGIGFHEAAHAYMATSLGDDLPRRQGRVTLNPLAHLDPPGTVMMLLAGFGWGKPVEWSGRGLKVSPRTAALLVSLAGPLSNFVMAGLLAIPVKLEWTPYINPFSSLFGTNGLRDYAGLFLTSAVYMNCVLGAFNLIPIHPLDGFKVVLGLMPRSLASDWANLARFGPGVLMLLLFAIPYFLGRSPLGDIMGPSVGWLVRRFTGVG